MLLAHLADGRPVDGPVHPGGQPEGVPRRFGLQHPAPLEVAHGLEEVGHVGARAVEASGPRGAVLREEVVYGVPGGAPPPGQEAGALEALREPGEQVELQGEAGAPVLFF